MAAFLWLKIYFTLFRFLFSYSIDKKETRIYIIGIELNDNQEQRGNEMLVNNELITKNGQKNYASFKNAEKAVEKKTSVFLAMGIRRPFDSLLRGEFLEAGQVRYLIVEKDDRFFPVVFATGITFQYWVSSGFMIVG